MVEAAITTADAVIAQATQVTQKIIELRVELPEFQRTVDERGNEVVFYMVHVALGRRKWKLEKRFNNFFELDKSMRLKHPGLPKLPAKTYFKLKTDQQIDNRRAQLHTYLQEIVNRPDMRTNPAFRSWLEIDEQIPESVTYQPVKMAEINDLMLGARDFCYVESQGYLFVAMSEMNIGSRLDSYITNFTMPWEKKKQRNASNNDAVYSTVGAVTMYRMKLTKDEDGVVNGWTFTSCWSKSFALQTGSMYWEDSERILYIGFDQGKVVRLQLAENPMNYTELDEVGVHTLRVTGITANPESASFTSVSDDGTLKVTENSSGSVVATITKQQTQLKQLITFQNRSAIAVSDNKGNFTLYGATGSPPDLLVSLQVESKSEIKGLGVSSNEHYVVAGCVDGTITIFDLGAPGKERLAKPLVTLQGNKNVRCLAWRERPRREIIAGHADGLVTVWDFKQQKPIFVLQAHTSAITKLEWHEDKQVLITCAKDKHFKVWQFPHVWVDEDSVDLQRMPDQSAIRKSKTTQAKANGGQRNVAAAAQQAESSDSDDDGLGRIKQGGTRQRSPGEQALPLGLGQVFNMNNPLASAKPKPQPQQAQVDISKPLGAAQASNAVASCTSASEETKEESKDDEAGVPSAEALEESKSASEAKPSPAKPATLTRQDSESGDDSDDLGGWAD